MADCSKDNKDVSETIKEVNERLNHLLSRLEENENFDNESKELRDIIELCTRSLDTTDISIGDLTDLYAERCVCYILVNEYENASEDADKIIELRPEWYRGYFLKSQFHRYNNDQENYEKCLQRARSLFEIIENEELRREFDEKLEDFKSLVKNEIVFN